MKKIIAILLVGIFAASIGTASAVRIPILGRNLQMLGPAYTTDAPEWADGNFSGVFAEKNETGYNILGTMEGYYSTGFNWTAGQLAGVWAFDNGSASGEFNGYIFHRLFLGQYNVTDGNDTGWFIGLFKMNQTTNEFQAISLILTGQDHLIRYGLGTYQEFQ